MTGVLIAGLIATTITIVAIGIRVIYIQVRTTKQLADLYEDMRGDTNH